MSFLNIWAFWIAAAVVPALLILYFLKLRRRSETVSSTLLWKRAVQDLQVNAPFQKLRKNLLLLLQLLILGAAVFALARPIIQAEKTVEERVVVLIDRSASMNTIEPKENRSRLDIAKEQAIRRVKTYNRTGAKWFSFLGPQQQTQVMVIAFADTATVVSPFITNTSDIEDLINRIEPTDAPTDMREAVKLAQAYMAPPTMLTDTMAQATTPGGMNSTPVPSEAGARLVLFSDGRLGDTSEIFLQTANLEWVKIGDSDDNIGITTLRARRNYEQPEILDIFATIQNFGAAPVETDVSLYIDGVMNTVRAVKLGAFVPPRNEKRTPEAESENANASEKKPDTPATPPPATGSSSTSLSFEFPLTRAGVIELRLSRDDPFSIDNRAWAVIGAPRKLRLLVVTQGNDFLDFVLKGLPLEESPFVTPTGYEARRAEFETENRSNYDAVIFDKYVPAQLPAGNYFFIGEGPAIPEIKLGEESSSAEPIIWWDETHPVLRYAGLESVLVGKSRPMQIPREAERLIEGTKGPLLARYAKDGRNYLVLSFAIEASNWWYNPSFPVFIYNAIRYVGGGGADLETGPLRPGATLRIPLPPDAKNAAKLVLPSGEKSTLSPDAMGVARFAGTSRVGIYRVEPGVEGRDKYAVNLEDDWESRVGPPQDTISIGGSSAKVGKTIDASTPEIWRWFIGAALAVLLLEWWIYNRRVML